MYVTLFIGLAIVEASLDFFHKSKPNEHQNSHQLYTVPFDYGRKPLSNEEIEAINVRNY